MKNSQSDTPRKKPAFHLVIPFLAVMAVLAIVACILPLRPTVSYSEKRKLAPLPELTVGALVSGQYFDELSTWYSDTFPGRESWLQVSQGLSSLHGYGEFAIEGDLPAQLEEIPDIPAPTKPAPADTPAPTLPPVTESTQPAGEDNETEADQPEDDGGEILLDAIITDGTVFQMGDFGFYPVGFSEGCSNRYAKLLSDLATALESQGVRVVSCPPPTAVGIRVDPKYYEQLRSSPQDEILGYMHGSMTDNVCTVDTHAALIAHKDEYLFFNTDHHWTSRAAYYCYAAACEAMGMEAPPLDAFEEWNEGEFRGSLYGRCPHTPQLAKDTMYVYKPPANLSMTICNGGTYETESQVFTDLSSMDPTTKYMTFLAGDRPMVHVINEDLPEDAGTCLIIKDSFGNCFVPYFGLNYRNVYAIDYRKYKTMTLPYFIRQYGVEDVIFAANMMSTQTPLGVSLLENFVGPMY